MVRIEDERTLKAVRRFLSRCDAQQACAAAMEDAHLVLAPVQPMPLRQLLFAIQLAQRFLHVILRQPDEPEEPM